MVEQYVLPMVGNYVELVSTLCQRTLLLSISPTSLSADDAGCPLSLLLMLTVAESFVLQIESVVSAHICPFPQRTTRQ
jgi:hypothetical protein